MIFSMRGDFVCPEDFIWEISGIMKETKSMTKKSFLMTEVLYSIKVQEITVKMTMEEGISVIILNYLSHSLFHLLVLLLLHMYSPSKLNELDLNHQNISFICTSSTYSIN